MRESWCEIYGVDLDDSNIRSLAVTNNLLHGNWKVYTTHKQTTKETVIIYNVAGKEEN
jgi:hypothetical protein